VLAQRCVFTKSYIVEDNDSEDNNFYLLRTPCHWLSTSRESLFLCSLVASCSTCSRPDCTRTRYRSLHIHRWSLSFRWPHNPRA